METFSFGFAFGGLFQNIFVGILLGLLFVKKEVNFLVDFLFCLVAKDFVDSLQTATARVPFLVLVVPLDFTRA
jgi:hypothetical protein